MANSKIASTAFFVDDYVGVLDFERLVDKTKANPLLIASITGCVEGIIQPVRDKTCFTFIGIYKIECSSNYLFLNIYNFIKNNNKVFNYIIKYFNLWHGCENRDISYDDYNKRDLCNNFNHLAEILYEEGKLASILKDDRVAEEYNVFYDALSSF